MNRWFSLTVLLLPGVLTFSAQDFKIKSVETNRIVIEHPACFDEAYLFINKTTSLTTGEWETVEYVQVAEENPPVGSTAAVVPAMQGSRGFFRIHALSFADSDGDGMDDVTEYGRGSDPYTPDAPAVTLPPDNGDPQPVPGSVDTAPGDWNTPPQTDYRSAAGYHGAINSLILALDGINGTFTASSTVEELGA